MKQFQMERRGKEGERIVISGRLMIFKTERKYHTGSELMLIDVCLWLQVILGCFLKVPMVRDQLIQIRIDEMETT